MEKKNNLDFKKEFDLEFSPQNKKKGGWLSMFRLGGGIAGKEMSKDRKPKVETAESFSVDFRGSCRVESWNKDDETLIAAKNLLRQRNSLPIPCSITVDEKKLTLIDNRLGNIIFETPITKIAQFCSAYPKYSGKDVFSFIISRKVVDAKYAPFLYIFQCPDSEAIAKATDEAFRKSYEKILVAKEAKLNKKNTMEEHSEVPSQYSANEPKPNLAVNSEKDLFSFEEPILPDCASQFPQRSASSPTSDEFEEFCRNRVTKNTAKKEHDLDALEQELLGMNILSKAPDSSSQPSGPSPYAKPSSEDDDFTLLAMSRTKHGHH